MAQTAQIKKLHRLCRLYGIETSYLNIEGFRRQASPDALLATLRALGAPLNSFSDLPEVTREHIHRQWQQMSEPVTVCWDKEPAKIELRLPSSLTGHSLDCRLELENGRVINWIGHPYRMPLVRHSSVEGISYELRQLILPAVLPWGYHRLVLELPGRRHEITVISAPRQAYTGFSAEGRRWGVFLPLYALQSAKNQGAGDFSGLAALLDWVGKIGGGFVGTLPLLSAFLDEPFAPSPYEPVSRLFWNEFYIDLNRVEEIKNCLQARELINSPGFREATDSLKAASLVDYRRGMALKRKVLEICCRECFDNIPGRRESLRRWTTQTSPALDYARFRATMEKHRSVWTHWPDRMRDGILREGDGHPENERYHLYAQWVAHQQIRDLSAKARRDGRGLYLDFPLGVHRSGYDLWRERNCFSLEASGGAPPDQLFTAGQDWGFPPLHPERIREKGYRYYIAALRNLLQHAGILRLDHVMGLHRLFWVPRGFPAGEGVYVRYRSEEFYAVLSLESHRYRTLLVGEDLGLVPPYVRKAMARHRVYRMYTLPSEHTGNPQKILRPVPAGAMAALNTHDMPPFASYWQEQQKNPRDRAALPIYLYRRGWLHVPTNNTKSLLRASLCHLAASRAELMTVNLEDLWLETEPQNVPGTVHEYPNWRRKARLSLEEFSSSPEVLETLQEINRLRNHRSGRTGVKP